MGKEEARFGRCHQVVLNARYRAVLEQFLLLPEDLGTYGTPLYAQTFLTKNKPTTTSFIFIFTKGFL